MMTLKEAGHGRVSWHAGREATAAHQSCVYLLSEWDKLLPPFEAVGYSLVCLCGAVYMYMCVCVKRAERRQKEQDKEQMCLCSFSCVSVSLCACLIRAGSQACFSALQQLNYKTCCNPSCSL